MPTGSCHPAEVDLAILTELARKRGGTPLPVETYPRVIEKNEPGQGYYMALGLVLGVWMITPLSCAYLIYYALYPSTFGLTGHILAAYAITEVLFSIYQQYLIRLIQTPSPPKLDQPLEEKLQQFVKVLHAGLAYSEPLQPISHPEGPLADPDALYQWKLDIYREYMKGSLTKAQYHHIIDSKYERSIGMQEVRRVAKSTRSELSVVDAFLEEKEGDREARLRAEIEGDVGAGEGLDEYEGEGVLDRDGNPVWLHEMDKRAIEFRERLRTWFDHAPWSSLRKDNILIWLSFVCFNVPLAPTLANPEHAVFLHKIYDIVQARTGTIFPDGHDTNIRTIRLTLDPVIAKSRPLLLYALSNFLNWFLREMWMPYRGMGLYEEAGIQYLIRIPQHWTPEKGKSDPNAMPVVFLHGLGFGLLQNALLLEELLNTLPTHPIVFPLAPHTAQALFHPKHLQPWSKDEFVRGFKSICEKWGFWEQPKEGQCGGPERWGGISLLSHSNGSVGHAWILKDCPEMVRRSTFVDPVVFCLWEGDVCHAFCYRKPSAAIELLLYYFISTEVGISNYIQRHFDWGQNTLFVDEIPHLRDETSCQIFLGAQDIIVDAGRVRRYLENHGVKVGKGLWWDEDAGHGDGLIGDSLRRVVNFVGTGNVRGWEGFMGRNELSDEKMRKLAKGRHGTGAGSADGEEEEASDSDHTMVDEEGKKDL